MSWYYKEKKIRVYRPILNSYEIDLIIKSLKNNDNILWSKEDKKLLEKMKIAKYKLEGDNYED